MMNWGWKKNFFSRMLKSFINWKSLFMNEKYRRMCATLFLFNMSTDQYFKYDMNLDILNMIYTFFLKCEANVFQIQLNFQNQIDFSMFFHERFWGYCRFTNYQYSRITFELEFLWNFTSNNFFDICDYFTIMFKFKISSNFIFWDRLYFINFSI